LGLPTVKRILLHEGMSLITMFHTKASKFKRDIEAFGRGKKLGRIPTKARYQALLSINRSKLVLPMRVQKI
jgi:hypothetical protein